MSTSGSKSNEHVAHFLVDIHSYTAFTQQYLIKIQSRLGAPSLRKVPQKNPVFFIKIPVPDIPSDVYTWPKARHRLVYASDPGDIPVLPV